MGANLKEVRLRMASVKSTMQITKAMKMVSASKLRRATDKIVQIRPYANQLNEVLTNIVSNLQGNLNLSLAENRELKKVLIVVITGDKGLCGGFNANVVKLAKKLINEKYADLHQKGGLELLFVGKKGLDGLKSFSGYKNLTFTNILSDMSFDNVSKVSEHLMALFQNKEYDRIEVVYNMFKNAAVQFPTAEQYLPIHTTPAESGAASADYIFEPGKEEILETLVPNILKTQFFRFLLDSNASEHGSRMTAMDKATENANDLLKDLGVMYNRARQAAITTELSEIVSGAAALSAE
ncbi:MAG TPA: ATP synthase F1 subunit gamma [Chitinophagales bacterium]|nr:ATP synthase F1 subunit gamma [Chitinophagales bacterium]